MIANPLVRFLENHLKLVRKHSSAVIIILVLAGVVAGIYLLSSRLLAGCIELLKLESATVFCRIDTRGL